MKVRIKDLAMMNNTKHTIEQSLYNDITPKIWFRLNYTCNAIVLVYIDA